MIDLEGHGAEEQDQEPVVQSGVGYPGPGVAHERLHHEPATETLYPLSPKSGATFRHPQRPALGPAGEEMEHEPDETGHRHVEDHLEGNGDVAEHLATHFEVRMLGNGPQDPECKSPQREEDPETFEDLRYVGASLLRCGLLLPLLGQGHGR